MAVSLRDTNIDQLQEREFDVCIVGAGINGAVAAAALSGQGVRVALIDKGDFACATSSQSSNLAWGGIKYLENRELPLVWDLCGSRNHLAKHYPSTVKEIRFLTTIRKDFRFPAWFVFLGSILYWAMGRFKTSPPRYRTSSSLIREEPRIRDQSISAGIEYSDCYLHDCDARFVFGFVRSALDHGAVAANYVEAQRVERSENGWQISVCDKTTDKTFEVRARSIINACGPWVDNFNALSLQQTEYRHAFSKGVHLMVDRVSEHNRILAFFASDGRLFFVIPMGPKTCIGTTDSRVEQPTNTVTEKDREFILNNANQFLNLGSPLTPDDIITERCGVRPLAVKRCADDDDWLSLSRHHALEFDAEKRYLSVFGGKLTDCLNIGEEICQLLENNGLSLPRRDYKWYGEPSSHERRRFYIQATSMGLDDMADPRSCEPLSEHLWRRYGSAAFDMLAAIRKDPANAERVIDSAEYLRCEIEHAGRHEMIVQLDDFLRRRSKISLVVRKNDYLNSPGLREVCELLFGDDAEQRLQEYVEYEQAH